VKSTIFLENNDLFYWCLYCVFKLTHPEQYSGKNVRYEYFFKKKQCVTKCNQSYPNYVWWKIDFCDKRRTLFLRFLEIMGGEKHHFFWKIVKVTFFENVCTCHEMVNFFQKMSKKDSPKITKIRFCYGKMLFAKCDKVAELTFFGADFRLLWSTLGRETWPAFLHRLRFSCFPRKPQAMSKVMALHTKIKPI